MPDMHSGAPPFYHWHMHAQHCMTPHHTYCTQLEVALLCFFLVSSYIHCTFLKGHALTRLFTCSCMLLLARFCARFLSFFPDFVLFFHIWRDLWVILVLCILVCCSLFCEFLDFLHFREFLVLVGFCSVLSAGLADNHLHS